MKEFYNLDHLLKVRVIDRRLNHSFQYYPAKKTWFSNREGGFYNRLSFLCDGDSAYPYTEEELILFGLVVVDGRVYDKPRVELTFVDKIEKTVVLDTYNEAVEYGKRVSDRGIRSCLEID